MIILELCLKIQREERAYVELLGGSTTALSSGDLLNINNVDAGETSTVTSSHVGV